ncbi:hypothetical protein D3P04_17555 [Paracoccus onubensis]|uniref:Uncharacterized protein n=2 Tax=Paracoccus onubensis TaxID=1675788 RepID=A0A418SPK6_9RHOB|nr:hypothetical protein D3P04_17555 [Paracoccus onubensis]
MLIDKAGQIEQARRHPEPAGSAVCLFIMQLSEDLRMKRAVLASSGPDLPQIFAKAAKLVVAGFRWVITDCSA